MRDALRGTDLPEDCIQLVTDVTHESANELMHMNAYVDVLIPRGSKRLIDAVVQNSTVPVIQTGSGVCHIYVDKDADINMAADIIFNAKTSRPSVCNAAECMLIHRDIAKRALPVIAARLREKNTEIRGDGEVMEILRGEAVPATEADWGHEYGDYIIAAHVVGSIDEAIEYVYRYSTGHSECIVTNNDAAAEKYLSSVDAAAVYHNASTRFTDGGEFGLGAEIGISTQKLHARGPLGLNELTSMKFKVYGSGQVR
jgi:glutamate-5-semialdehyde dehydrogenase